MRLLLDEMYPRALAAALNESGVDAVTLTDLRLTGAPDTEVFAAAQADGRAILTENVADFTRLAADRVTRGEHHAGILVALSSRFSRRPSGVARLVAAVCAVGDELIEDRVVYLRPSRDLS